MLLPRDVISGTSAMTLCLSVSDSSRSFIEKNERIELVLGMGAFFSLLHTAFYGNPGTTKIRRLFSVNPEPYRLARCVTDT